MRKRFGEGIQHDLILLVPFGHSNFYIYSGLILNMKKIKWMRINWEWTRLICVSGFLLHAGFYCFSEARVSVLLHCSAIRITSFWYPPPLQHRAPSSLLRKPHNTPWIRLPRTRAPDPYLQVMKFASHYAFTFMSRFPFFSLSSILFPYLLFSL